MIASAQMPLDSAVRREQDLRSVEDWPEEQAFPSWKDHVDLTAASQLTMQPFAIDNERILIGKDEQKPILPSFRTYSSKPANVAP